jgi:membrane protein YqaA with SNARE-associated domain
MDYTLFALFSSAFLAATILPAQSEILLAALAINGKFPLYELIIIATAGNVLGSVVNYYLGIYLINFKDHKYFPIKKNILKKAEKLYQDHGSYTLLFAWLPIIGDAFPFLAGIFKTKFWLFLILVTIGKSIRYILVTLFVLL